MTCSFDNLSYEDFRRMAGDPELSVHEKIGFPDSYREGYEEVIFSDIRSEEHTSDLQSRHNLVCRLRG